ncbi:carboxypeptidase-like regulatory domain-containing protein [Nocardioides conyzicola]|uniref:alpha-amylase n=1 Tax=Nocardioides conyzicola TaxID=1651781 RepID=A0ABP8XJS2_9ACTN
MLPSRWTRTALVAVVALLASLVLVGAPVGAEAASDKGVVTGVLNFPQKDHPKVQMLWFDRNWKYLGRKSAGGGSFALNLAPGTYHLQFIDLRKAYDTKKYAPTDVKVTVRAGSPTIRNVTMKRGGFVTGTIRTGDGKPAKGARVVAANRAEQSFETTANDKGQFAVGGLPEGKYSVFTWDKKKRWVDKSFYAGSVKPRTGKNLKITMRKPAGAMRVLLYTPNGSLAGRTSVTVTSKATGQWWTATAKGGTAVFEGLYPGRYTLKFDGLGVWLPRTGSVVSAKVKPNRTDIGKFKITKRGGWVTGRIVDAGQPATALRPPFSGGAGATINLYSASGAKLATTTSSASGTFTLSGALTTQSNLTITVDPTGSSGGYMRGQGYCHFDHAEFTGFKLATSRATATGDLPVARTTGQTDPSCTTP